MPSPSYPNRKPSTYDVPVSKNQKRVRHPCLCGYRAPTYGQYRKHQAACEEWRNRPNPRGLSIWRRANSRKRLVLRTGLPPTALELLTNPDLSRFLVRNDVDPRVWAVVLRMIAARYENH